MNTYQILFTVEVEAENLANAQYDARGIENWILDADGVTDCDIQGVTLVEGVEE